MLTSEQNETGSMIVELFAGTLLALLLFAALLWSSYRAFMTKGGWRLNAGALSLATLGGMLTITYLSPGPGAVAGLVCVVCGLAATWHDPRWSKLLPLVQCLFGLVLITGLPWVAS